VLHWLCRKLYWVDSEHKTLVSVDVGDESNRITMSSLGDVTGSGHVYGLALDDAGNTAYVSCWMGNASIIQVNLSDGTPIIKSFWPYCPVSRKFVVMKQNQMPTHVM